MHYLYQHPQSESVTNIAIDSQWMVDVPQNYGDISKKLLQNIVRNNAANEICLLFDIYDEHSIKYCQHAKRNNFTAEFNIRDNVNENFY